MHQKFFVPFVVGIQLITGATASGSIVSGKAFDRIAIFLFENQDYDKSYGDRTLLPENQFSLPVISIKIC